MGVVWDEVATVLDTGLTRENKIRLHNSLIDVKFSIWSLTVPNSLNDGINIFAEGSARRICYREVLCYGEPHVLKLFLLFKDTIVTIYVLARNEQILAFGENRTHTTIKNPKLEIARLKYARAKCDISNNIWNFLSLFLGSALTSSWAKAVFSSEESARVFRQWEPSCLHFAANIICDIFATAGKCHVLPNVRLSNLRCSHPTNNH